tara:strand:+ start:204 stop:512 length:309 start_codon:yes stop_codon:yes gene_type:complete
MNKKILIFSLLILSNCTAPGSAFLGPIYTAAKTGSIAQVSISYGTNKIVEEINLKQRFNKTNEKKKSIFKDIPYVDEDPVILLTYKVSKIKISEVEDPEPLP